MSFQARAKTKAKKPRKSKLSEPEILPESDDFTLGTHPRKKMGLVGHQKTAEALVQSFTSGRIPQAILLSGPQGIGKATFVYHFIRALERYGNNISVDNIYETPDDAVQRRIATIGTGNLKIIRRNYNDKTRKFYSSIRMDDVRALKSFFTLSSHGEGYRFCVIDSVDDMIHGSDSVPNALLKTLEEPPKNTIFFLLAHNEGNILPTIRSRCSFMRMTPPTTTELGHILSGISSFSSIQDAQKEKIMSDAGGSVRRALILTDPVWMGLSRGIKSCLLRTLPVEQAIQVRQVREKFFDGAESSMLLSILHILFTSAVSGFMRHSVKEMAGSPKIFYQTQLFEKLNQLFQKAEEYNLTPSETFDLALHLVTYYQYQTHQF